MGSLFGRRKISTEILQIYGNPASSPRSLRCVNLSKLIESNPCCYAGHVLVVNEPCERCIACRNARSKGCIHAAFGEFHV